jgi:hypothetical protein
MLILFDKDDNVRWRAMGAANTPLALQCGINFKIEVRTAHHARLMEELKALEKKDPFRCNSSIYFQLRVIKS